MRAVPLRCSGTWWGSFSCLASSWSCSRRCPGGSSTWCSPGAVCTGTGSCSRRCSRRCSRCCSRRVTGFGTCSGPRIVAGPGCRPRQCPHRARTGSWLGSWRSSADTRQHSCRTNSARFRPRGDSRLTCQQCLRLHRLGGGGVLLASARCDHPDLAGHGWQRHRKRYPLQQAASSSFPSGQCGCRRFQQPDGGGGWPLCLKQREDTDFIDRSKTINRQM